MDPLHAIITALDQTASTASGIAVVAPSHRGAKALGMLGTLQRLGVCGQEVIYHGKLDRKGATESVVIIRSPSPHQRGGSRIPAIFRWFYEYQFAKDSLLSELHPYIALPVGIGVRRDNRLKVTNCDAVAALPSPTIVILDQATDFITSSLSPAERLEQIDSIAATMYTMSEALATSGAITLDAAHVVWNGEHMVWVPPIPSEGPAATSAASDSTLAKVVRQLVYQLIGFESSATLTSDIIIETTEWLDSIG